MIARLHYITQPVEGYTYPQLVKQACEGGVRWVQLRMKKTSDEHWGQVVPEVKEICGEYEAQLIINDRVDMAKKYNADGVHLGQNDTPPEKARKRLGAETIIGGSAHNWEEFKLMARQKVDYMGVGPFRYTRTKKKLDPLLGLKGIQNIAQRNKKAGYEIPIVAIGGILPADVRMLMTTGIHGVAVSSGINKAEDIHKAAQQYQIELKMSLHESTTANCG